MIREMKRRMGSEAGLRIVADTGAEDQKLSLPALRLMVKRIGHKMMLTAYTLPMQMGSKH